MDFTVLTAGKDDNDRHLDRVIRKFVAGSNLNGIYKAMRKGLVKVNDKKCSCDTRIFAGDSIKIATFLLENNSASPETSETCDFVLPIVYKNDHLLFINKPYDKTVHGSPDSLDKIVQEYYRNNSSQSSLSFKSGPLHRLDRKTTGLLAFSWDLQGARWFSQNIATHFIQKEYVAILTGLLDKKEEWIDYIEKDDTLKENNVFHMVTASNDSDKGKYAHTTAEPLGYGEYKEIPFTYAKILITTGRTHQIRSQASLHGYPLLGDTAYGAKKIECKQDFFLHAHKMIFPQENPVELPSLIECPLPKPFLDFLEKHSF